MIDIHNLQAVVVWYKPGQRQAELLWQFLSIGLHTIVVDNSDGNNAALLEALPAQQFCYLPMHHNMGIAAALNRGCSTAQQLGAQWVLTMDQDSQFRPDDLLRYIQQANEYSGCQEVALFSPLHNTHNFIPTALPRYSQLETAMTSGNLLSLSVFAKLDNGFREDLFIDAVDDEYCFRAKRHGYDIVRVNDIALTHPLGDIVEARCLMFTKKIHTHAPRRYYYIVRNYLRTADLYPEQRKRLHKLLRKTLLKELKRCLFYSYPQRWKRLGFIVRGFIDYRNGVSGEYPQHAA